MFKVIRGCIRSEGEQRYIWAALAIWKRLPEVRREEIRGLIGRIADSPAEGRALYDILVRGSSPQAVSTRTGIQLNRLYDMRREFYDGFRL